MASAIDPFGSVAAAGAVSGRAQRKSPMHFLKLIVINTLTVLGK
ncbi:hypothetical protein [Neobacillus vireti]